MHIFRNLFPGYVKSCPMRTKYRPGGIFKIPFRIIAGCFYDFFRIMARLITFECTEDFPPAFRIAGDFHLIIAHGRHRSIACYNRQISVCLRGLEFACHFLNIREGPSDTFRRDFKAEIIIWLKQYIFRLHQALAHSPVCRLPEISSFCVFQMRSPCDQCDFYVRKRRACQYTSVHFLSKMRKYQPLPVQVQHIRTAHGIQRDSASRLPRLHQQMYLRIVAERFKMSDSFYYISYRFFINNISGSKCHFHAKSVFDQALQYLRLHRSHQLHMNLAKFFIPHDPQHRIFFFKKS